MATSGEKDIKDFTLVSGINGTDYILLVTSGGTDGKLALSLLVATLKSETAPSIGATDNYWYIGGVKTSIQAIGKNPVFRKGDTAIQWKYADEADTAYQNLVLLSALKFNYTDFTTEQLDGLKLKFSDLTTEDKATLTGDNGKTPTFDIGTVTTVDAAGNASATVTSNGTETDGSPKYLINLSIPRGAAGSLGSGDAQDLTVTFTEATTRENLSTGEKISLAFGKIKKYFSDLATVAFTGSYEDLSGKPTIPTSLPTPASITFTGGVTGTWNGSTAKTVDIPTTLPASDVSTWAKSATKPDYTASEVGALSSSYYTGINSVTTLASLPVSKRVVLATLSAATNISLASDLVVGQELHVVITPSADITQPIPTTGGWSSMDGDSLSLTSGKLAEINILCTATGTYIVSSKVQE